MSTSNIVLLVIFVVWAVLMLKKHTGKAAASEVKQLVSDGAPLIDVRTTQEFTRGHLAGAKNIPLAELAMRADEIAQRTSLSSSIAGVARVAAPLAPRLPKPASREWQIWAR
jgi:hypothetical protein